MKTFYDMLIGMEGGFFENDGWLTEKPELNEECLLMIATWIESTFKPNSHWNYSLFEIRKMLLTVDNNQPEYYFEVFYDADSWGDLADLKADLYKVIKPLNTK